MVRDRKDFIMSILKPTDPSSAIKTLNGDSANTNSLINHALTVASNAYEKSESLDATVNGEKLKDPSGESIYQRDDDGNIIYNNDGTPVIKRDTSGLVTIVASKVSISQLEAESARIDNLEANSVTTETLNAEKARIDALETSKANIDDLNAEKARIDNLETNKADILTLNAEKARIDALETGKADISSLTAESARIDALEANKADITSLNAEIARIDSLETGKADIDLANVNNAWISNGVIKDASIANEKVISVSANKLTAGTIDASKITVTNLNADNITVGTINGARIGDSSIDLDKLSQEVPTKEYLDSVEKKLQEEIDGAIETFTVSEIPTLNNEPAANWTTDDVKSAHVGDLCYVVNSSSDNDGYCYRFQYNGTAYSWALIKDNDVTKAIQDIAELGGEVTQFKTDYTSKVSEIDGGIESLKSRTTAIETSLSTKVETSVFNTLKNTVDENSANITSLAETVTTKADSSTVTTLSNTVNEVKQTADANSSSISSLTTTVNSKADGSKVTALETKTSTIEQNLNGVTTKVTNLESTSEGFDTRLTAAEANITVTSDAITSKVSKNEVISAINQTAESVSIDASKINLNGAVTFTSFDSSLQTTINNKAETSDLEAVRTTADAAQDNALSAQEAADALDTDLNDFKSNEYSQINDKVGELVEYKGENEKEIGKIREELSKELVAQKFAKIENGSLILGEIDNTTAILTNAQFGFYAPNSEIPASYFGKDGDAWAFSIERGIITNDLRFNGFQWISRANRNMSLKWLE